ncbi:hypothetical protein J0X15_18355 [Roseibium sp. CAU 1637]|uniref:Uncharacterized protein n=1 Tax=Roseibium limicola TaxID=2816037 RepID=A0A939J8H2_9HYPH|nr:hypothetical protein [Roseibium limicola]MBO0347197.1 hypothetical protein [Roseibium limicola]
MGKIGATLLGAIVGGFSAVGAIIFWFGWGMSSQGQTTHLDPSRADYVDLLLTVATIFLGAIGLAVTVGALVIGLVALKTLREIKDEAARDAKAAAAEKINETMTNDLDPKVDRKVRDILPVAIKVALADNEHREEILTALARTGALDAAVGRIMERLYSGGPVMDPEDVVEGGDQE